MPNENKRYRKIRGMKISSSSFVVQHGTDVWSGKGSKTPPPLQWSPRCHDMKGRGVGVGGGGVNPKKVWGGGEGRVLPV